MACPSCNRWNADNATCVQVRCLACGVEQCHSNGSARGTCGDCRYGMLPGWSCSNNPDVPGRYPLACVTESIRCRYAGCDAMAVYRYLPGAKKTACKAHGDAVLARRAERRRKAA